jgi:hypothetical protein
LEGTSVDIEFMFNDQLYLYEAYPDQIWPAIALIGGFVALVQIQWFIRWVHKKIYEKQLLEEYNERMRS